MIVHVFDSTEEDRNFWTDVLPGDIVVSPGSMGTLAGVTSDKVFRLALAPLLVISKRRGMPNSPGMDDWVTFTVVSRHGILNVVKHRKKKWYESLL